MDHKSETPNLSLNYPKLCLRRRVGMFNLLLGRFGFCNPRLSSHGITSIQDFQVMGFPQCFSCLLDEGIANICKFNFFHSVIFLSTLSVLRCTWTGWINLKILLGYNINYLSIWPFMRHPWFPTRKASKLTFVFFQLQLFSPCLVFSICSRRWSHLIDCKAKFSPELEDEKVLYTSV